MLVLQPGSGDSLQALKAGIMEIPDVIVVNKRDYPNAETLVADVRQVLSLGHGPAVPIVLTDALAGGGVPSSGRWSRSSWLPSSRAAGWTSGDGGTSAPEVFAVASARARRRLEDAVRADPELARLLEAVEQRRLDPLTAVRDILRQVFHFRDVDHGDEDSSDTR